MISPRYSCIPDEDAEERTANQIIVNEQVTQEQRRRIIELRNEKMLENEKGISIFVLIFVCFFDFFFFCSFFLYLFFLCFI
jgi:hypothetical protein